MKIAVIDEGARLSLKGELNIVDDLVVNSDNQVVNRNDNEQIISPHGFNVCKIINTYASEAELVSIRIFNSSDVKTNIKTLIAAFQYCLEKEIPIIHFSGGSVNLVDDYLLRGVIKKIINNDQIIISAHSNKKGLSFPAIYPGVFSVRASELFDSHHDSKSPWGYSFFMTSQHEIDINKTINYTTQIANSYAAPVLTAKIYNSIRDKDNSITTILNDLEIRNNIFLFELPVLLDNAIIINLSGKDIFEEILFFKAKDIYNNMEFKDYSKDYIFIPHRNEKINIGKFREFVDSLNKEQKNIRIFYLGIIDNNIRKVITSSVFEFWIPPHDHIYPIKFSHVELSDCGTIFFKGESKLVYYVMTYLRDFFLADGFNCLAISDYLQATLYGIYYFEDVDNSIRRKQLEYVLEPDAELIYTKSEDYMETDNSMLIKVRKEEDRIKLLINSEESIEEVNVYSIADMKNVFNRIVTME